MDTTKQTSDTSDSPSRSGRIPPDELKKLTLCGSSLLAGLVLVAGDLSWRILPQAAPTDSPIPPMPLAAAAGFWGCLHGNGIQFCDVLLMGLGILLVVYGVIVGTNATFALPSAERSCASYQRHLVGLGFALLTDGVINVVALAGYARRDQLRLIFADGVETTQLPCALLILTCLGMAIEGALFFFCNSLYEKLSNDPDIQASDEFQPDLFWGGLWFRMGEAVIFTNVLLLFILSRVSALKGDSSDIRFYMLPLLALLCGMFLQPAEALVYGIMKRLFAGFSGFTGGGTDAPAPSLNVLTFDASKADSSSVDPDDALALREQLLKLAGVKAVTWSKRGGDPSGTLKLLVMSDGPSSDDLIKWAAAHNIELKLIP